MAESDLIRGNVDTIILKVLYEGDRYGYDLIKQINSRGDGQWEIKQPTVYACLKRLNKQGFISSYWDSSESDGGRRKYYSLTDSGKQVFLKYKNEFERATALFGGLISDSDTVFMDDDYSDVEDETYSVSKRRAPRQKRKKQEEQPSPSTDNMQKTLIEDSDGILTESDAVVEPEPENNTVNAEAETEKDDAFFEDFVSLAESIAEEPPEQQAPSAVFIEDEPEEQTQLETQAQADAEVPPAREPIDPRSIIEHYYQTERGQSYSDVRGKIKYEEPREQILTPSAPVQKPSAPPAPVQSKQVEPTRPTPPPAPVSGIGFPDPNESTARREYKIVLSDLVERMEVAPPVVRDEPPELPPQTEQAAAETAVQSESETDKQFIKVKTSARDLGNDVQIAEHNNSAKQYARKYYYYSNRLMMTHYTIMCAAMFIIGLTLFLTFYTGLKIRMEYDYLLYMAAGLLPIIMFIVAVICYAGEPDKRKRININFNFSVFIRCIIMIQVAVVIYCVNLIWGMPVGFSYGYLPTLIIPLAYALFIPIGKVIFMALLQSGNYAVE